MCQEGVHNLPIVSSCPDISESSQSEPTSPRTPCLGNVSVGVSFFAFFPGFFFSYIACDVCAAASELNMQSG